MDVKYQRHIDKIKGTGVSKRTLSSSRVITKHNLHRYTEGAQVILKQLLELTQEKPPYERYHAYNGVNRVGTFIRKDFVFNLDKGGYEFVRESMMFVTSALDKIPERVDNIKLPFQWKRYQQPNTACFDIYFSHKDDKDRKETIIIKYK